MQPNVLPYGQKGKDRVANDQDSWSSRTSVQQIGAVAAFPPAFRNLPTSEMISISMWRDLTTMQQLNNRQARGIGRRVWVALLHILNR